MFDGALVSVPDMPWSYLPTLFALQLPEVLLGLIVAGVAGTAVALTRSDVSARRKSILLMLALAATLPLVIAMVKRPALYNGIRHFIFVIPPMTVLAGTAFAWGMDRLKDNRRSWQPAAVAIFSFGLLLPLSEMIRLHPYQYTHFNHIAGTGLRWPARAARRATGNRAARAQMEGCGVRSAAPRTGGPRSRLHDRLG
jgi:hypothetical protein